MEFYCLDDYRDSFYRFNVNNLARITKIWWCFKSSGGLSKVFIEKIMIDFLWVCFRFYLYWNRCIFLYTKWLWIIYSVSVLILFQYMHHFFEFALPQNFFVLRHCAYVIIILTNLSPTSFLSTGASPSRASWSCWGKQRANSTWPSARDRIDHIYKYYLCSSN